MLFVLSLPQEVCSQRLDWLPSAISQQYVSEKSHTNVPSQVITRLWAPFQGGPPSDRRGPKAWQKTIRAYFPELELRGEL